MLLNCTLQTPVLACSLGYCSDPLPLKEIFEYLGNLVDAVLFTQPLKPFPKGNFISLANFFGSPLLHSFTRSQRNNLDVFRGRLGRILNFLDGLLLHSFTLDYSNRQPERRLRTVHGHQQKNGS